MKKDIPIFFKVVKFINRLPL